MAKLLNIQQIAELLQIHEKTVYKWMKQGRFPKPVKSWGSPRWDYEEVLKYMREDLGEKEIVANCNL
jgi:excisionase family DNA binding protein